MLIASQDCTSAGAPEVGCWPLPPPPEKVRAGVARVNSTIICSVVPRGAPIARGPRIWLQPEMMR